MKNKRVIDKIKQETKSIPIVEFVGLKSEMYSNIKEDTKETKRQNESINICKSICKNMFLKRSKQDTKLTSSVRNI